MQFSDEWKRIWPIASVYSSPLLNENTSQNPDDETSVGPLFFNPSPETLTHLFSSPSHLSPRLTPPFPSLPLRRFLSTTSSTPLLYSTASSLISENTITHSDYKPNNENFNNSLQLLTCPFSSTIYVFLPAGENLEKIGILGFSVGKDLSFEVKDNNGKPFLVENSEYQHRITKLLINPVSDCCDASVDNEGFVVIAYLLACCKYSVGWYRIKVRKNLDSGSSGCPVVECVGSKGFRRSGVVDACWSRHLVEESAVLLECGKILLFDVNLCAKNSVLVRKKVDIEWDTVGDKCIKVGDGNVWLGCEFCWHPRILVVAHLSRVFLVDMRFDDCRVKSLLNIEKVSGVENDGFVALSMAGTDGFHFAVASKELLLLCDVRIPQMPLLRWVHGLESPNHMSVFKLATLRSNSSEEVYSWASKCGYCILLGSLWNDEFNIFCYGPDNGKATCLPKLSKLNHFSAWGLPSHISLSGRGCHCGACLVREEFYKETLHRWIDWRQKKDLVMGFGLVDQEISSQLSDPNNFGGFHLIRLLSSGKLEVQKYCASWKLEQISEKAHEESIFDVENYDLYDGGELTYDLPKKHRFITLTEMKKCWLDNDNAAAFSNPDVLDGYAVNLGDDTDNLTEEVSERKYSPSCLKTPVHINLSGVSSTRFDPGSSAPVTSATQTSAYQVKKEAGAPESIDEGCPYDLKFNDRGIELGQQGLQISNQLVALKLKFQKGFKL